MFNRVWRTAFAFGLMLALSSCNLLNQPGGGQTVISGPPVVRLASPLPNATYLEGVSVNIQAQVTNAGTDVDRVEVVVDGSIIATQQQPNSSGAPAFTVSQSWKAAGVGQHSISVTAFRADGSSSTPATVNVNVVAPGTTPSPAPTTAGSGNPPGGIGNEPGGQSAGSNNAAPTNPPATATNAPPTNPPPPTNTPTPSKPVATFNQGVNVRSGPGTIFNPPIGAFAANQTADVLAKSPDGTWFKVRYYNAEGWVFGQLVTVSGDVSSLPVDPGPPTPIPTATPVPVTPTPVTTINLVAGAIRLNPGSPRCKETYQVTVDVANLGSTEAPSGSLTIQDIAVRDGSVQQSVPAGFPAVPAGATVNSGNIPITSSTYFAEQHKIVAIVDPNNVIPETNENDNRSEITFTLEKGGC
ncbi:MAG: SH3 domain-containing protein [Chloroflexi bacterium]|nr:SH3 domain-containing protein [Chloroflexota bacterium]